MQACIVFIAFIALVTLLPVVGGSANEQEEMSEESITVALLVSDPYEYYTHASSALYHLSSSMRAFLEAHPNAEAELLLVPTTDGNSEQRSAADNRMRNRVQWDQGGIRSKILQRQALARLEHQWREEGVTNVSFRVLSRREQLETALAVRNRRIADRHFGKDGEERWVETAQSEQEMEEDRIDAYDGAFTKEAPVAWVSNVAVHAAKGRYVLLMSCFVHVGRGTINSLHNELQQEGGREYGNASHWRARISQSVLAESGIDRGVIVAAPLLIGPDGTVRNAGGIFSMENLKNMFNPFPHIPSFPSLKGDEQRDFGEEFSLPQTPVDVPLVSFPHVGARVSEIALPPSYDADAVASHCFMVDRFAVMDVGGFDDQSFASPLSWSLGAHAHYHLVDVSLVALHRGYRTRISADAPAVLHLPTSEQASALQQQTSEHQARDINRFATRWWQLLLPVVLASFETDISLVWDMECGVGQVLGFTAEAIEVMMALEGRAYLSVHLSNMNDCIEQLSAAGMPLYVTDTLYRAAQRKHKHPAIREFTIELGPQDIGGKENSEEAPLVDKEEHGKSDGTETNGMTGESIERVEDEAGSDEAGSDDAGSDDEGSEFVDSAEELAQSILDESPITSDGVETALDGEGSGSDGEASVSDGEGSVSNGEESALDSENIGNNNQDIAVEADGELSTNDVREEVQRDTSKEGDDGVPVGKLEISREVLAIDRNLVVVLHRDPGRYRNFLGSTVRAYSIDPFTEMENDNTRLVRVVGRSMFETNSIPEMWLDACRDYVDEIWVPSHFNVETFIEAGVPEEKLSVVEEAMSASVFTKDICEDSFTESVEEILHSTPNIVEIPAREGRGGDRFTFLSVQKWEPRKAARETIRAFLRAFPNGERVQLLFRTQVDPNVLRNLIQEEWEEVLSHLCKVEEAADEGEAAAYEEAHGTDSIAHGSGQAEIVLEENERSLQSIGEHGNGLPLDNVNVLDEEEGRVEHKDDVLTNFEECDEDVVVEHPATSEGDPSDPRLNELRVISVDEFAPEVVEEGEGVHLSPEEDEQRLCREQFTQPPVILISTLYPFSELPRLFCVGDAFILASHGEGWGLPLMQAMLMELPTIAVNWSGNTEYMNDDNSWLVPVEELEDATQRDHQWAKIDHEKLSDTLLEVFHASPEEARASLANNFSRQAIADTIIARLQTIEANLEQYRAESVERRRRTKEKQHTPGGNFWGATSTPEPQPASDGRYKIRIVADL